MQLAAITGDVRSAPSWWTSSNGWVTTSIDVGTKESGPVDYPDIACDGAGRVSRGEVDRCILVCGTGLGMCIAANKMPGVRAAPCHDDLTAEMSRRHNDLNVLCLSADMLGERLIDRMVETLADDAFRGRPPCPAAGEDPGPGAGRCSAAGLENNKSLRRLLPGIGLLEWAWENLSPWAPIFCLNRRQGSVQSREEGEHGSAGRWKRGQSHLPATARRVLRTNGTVPFCAGRVGFDQRTGDGAMSDPSSPRADELEQLLRNAELRDELEPYYDESISRVNVQRLPLAAENEFLASMLAWERGADPADLPLVRARAARAAALGPL